MGARPIVKTGFRLDFSLARKRALIHLQSEAGRLSHFALRCIRQGGDRRETLILKALKKIARNLLRGSIKMRLQNVRRELSVALQAGR